MTGRNLMTRLASGDRSALREVYDLCARDLYLFARTVANGNQADAEDALQECFIRLWQNRQGLGAVRNLRAYLFTTIRNAYMNVARTEAREHKRRTERGGPSGLIAEGPADSRLDCERISAAIASLPEDQRNVVVLKVWGELTLAEIAEVIRESPNTVASRYRYGLRKLRDFLGDEP
jgi:RNA polymerase sigma-70 factor, ECF subfamily